MVSQVGATQTIVQQREVFTPVQGEIKLVEKGTSYYATFEIQKSAGKGAQNVKVDRELAETILECAGTGGRISKKEAAESILVKIRDGNTYGEGEKELTRMLLSACDDRNDVRLNGVKIRVTDPAETIFQTELPKWWGSLAKRGKADDTVLRDGVERIQKNPFI
jgi:hypothetical protein